MEEYGKGKHSVTLEEGRNVFANAMKKYRFDEASLEKLKDYYGYFWNKKKSSDVPRLYKNVFIFCNSDTVGRSIYETCVECLMSQGLIEKKEEVGYSFLGTEQDINEIKEMYAENAMQSPQIALKRKKFQSVIVALPEQGMAKEELYQAGTSLFYREFRDHITSKVSAAEVVFWELRKLLDNEQQFTEEFYIELQKYIQTVYPKREIESKQQFLQDACDRVWNKYYGKYEAGAIGGVDCVPDYQKDPEEIKAQNEIKENELSGNIKNVLLLNMSTLPKKKLSRNRYRYKDQETGISYEIFGYGQLEPIPKLLKKKLEKINEKLDLILITASEEAKKQNIIEMEEPSPYPDREVKCLVKKGNAVAFFEEQIGREDDHVKFKVFDCNEKDLSASLEEVVEFIRKIKEYNPQFKLYLDMHGGLRSVQLSIDAIINLLAIENIQVEDAFNIAGIQDTKKATQIMNVKKDIRVFDFVSGMNEFINYGRSKGLEDFFGKGNIIVNNIKSISDSIQTCDIDRFLSALDEMRETIENAITSDKETEQRLLNIFLENMKKDYGNLIDAEKRTDFDLLKWCERKGFYQAALTVIESRMPRFLEGKVYEIKVEETCEIKAKETRKVLGKKSRNEILQQIKPKWEQWKADCNYLLEQWCNFKIIGTNKDKNYMQLVVKKNQEETAAEEFWKREEVWIKDENGKDKFYKKYIINKDENIKDISKNDKNENKEIRYYFCFKFLKEMTEEDKRKFNIFMQLHMALKNQRNLANHAVSGDEHREEPENIFNAVRAYVEMTEYFLERNSTAKKSL